MKGDIFGNVYQQFCIAIKKDKWRERNENISSSCLCFIRVLFHGNVNICTIFIYGYVVQNGEPDFC